MTSRRSPSKPAESPGTKTEATVSGRFDWGRLSKQQIGRYAEYYVKMEFTLWGFDVYTAEVDDKGIDFVVRRGEDRFYDVQVKSIRTKGYVFFRKDVFKPRSGLYAAIVIFTNGKPPDLYLIPSITWLSPDSLFVDRDYVGKKSKPEWALNLSPANLAKLAPYVFESAVLNLLPR